MEVYERIRLLRKKYLDMSQEMFGERLGVSRSVIKNIELDALARPDQKLSLIKLMCKEFNVNEEWLLNGIEPMFIAPDTFSLNDYVKTHGASDIELDILKAYFELDTDVRKAVVTHFKEHFVNKHIEKESYVEYSTAEELEKDFPPVIMTNTPVEAV